MYIFPHKCFRTTEMERNLSRFLCVFVTVLKKTFLEFTFVQGKSPDIVLLLHMCDKTQVKRKKTGVMTIKSDII